MSKNIFIETLKKCEHLSINSLGKLAIKTVEGLMDESDKQSREDLAENLKGHITLILRKARNQSRKKGK
jgi:hypothetical protein